MKCFKLWARNPLYFWEQSLIEDPEVKFSSLKCFKKCREKIQTVVVQLMRFLRKTETLLRTEAKACVFYSGRKMTAFCSHVLRSGINWIQKQLTIFSDGGNLKTGEHSGCSKAIAYCSHPGPWWKGARGGTEGNEKSTCDEKKHRSEYSLTNKTDSTAALTLEKVSAIKGKPVILLWNHRKDVLKEKNAYPLKALELKMTLLLKDFPTPWVQLHEEMCHYGQPRSQTESNAAMI